MVNAGATPELVDVGRDFNIDAEGCRGDHPAHQRHPSGASQRKDGRHAGRHEAIAARHGLVIVEDACQSLGATINGSAAGSWGLTGCWSFYPFKILGGYGDGGAITTNDPRRSQLVGACATTAKIARPANTTVTGYTCLLDNLQAAFLT